MPTYEFKCTECNHQFERITKIADNEKPLGEPCPQCHTIGSVQRYHSQMPGLTNSFSLGRIKPPQEFRNILGAIHKNTPGSQLSGKF